MFYINLELFLIICSILPFDSSEDLYGDWDSGCHIVDIFGGISISSREGQKMLLFLVFWGLCSLIILITVAACVILCDFHNFGGTVQSDHAIPFGHCDCKGYYVPVGSNMPIDDMTITHQEIKGQRVLKESTIELLVLLITDGMSPRTK